MKLLRTNVNSDRVTADPPPTDGPVEQYARLATFLAGTTPEQAHEYLEVLTTLAAAQDLRKTGTLQVHLQTGVIKGIDLKAK